MEEKVSLVGLVNRMFFGGRRDGLTAQVDAGCANLLVRHSKEKGSKVRKVVNVFVLRIVVR